MGCPHTTFIKGQKVLVIFKDGTQLTGRFDGKKSGKVFVDDRKIKISDIRAMSIWRPKGG